MKAPEVTVSVATMDISLRDYFAAQALNGWISTLTDECLNDYDGDDEAFAQHQSCVALAAYGYADAMMAARGSAA